MSEDNKNLMSIPFLGNEINVRKGIGYIGYLTEAPITSLFIVREKGKYQAVFNNDIKVQPGEDREQFCKRVLAKIYTDLEAFVLKYTDQWNGWFTIHDNIIRKSRDERPEKFNAKRPVKFNSKEFMPFTDSSGHYLLDKVTYNSIEVSEPLLDTLRESADQDIKPYFDFEDVDTLELIGALHERHILIQ